MTDEEILAEWGPGPVHVFECEICGWCRCNSSMCADAPETMPVVIRDPPTYNDAACERCSEVLQRAPEIARWVFQVVKFQLAKERKRHDQTESQSNQEDELEAQGEGDGQTQTD